MRRLSACTLLLLLLQSFGAGSVLAQAESDAAHAHCSDSAATSATGTQARSQPSDGNGDAGGDHCGMPWMTGCASASSCTVHAWRAACHAVEMLLCAGSESHARSDLTPESAATELEAPPPRD